MPYLVACPRCEARLKSPRPIPVGRTLACPFCRAQFSLTRPAPAVVDPPRVVPQRPPAALPLPASPASLPRQPDEIPDAVILSELDDHPARSPAADRGFDDDRPVPKRRRSRDADDEEDPPRRRRRARPKGNGRIIALVAGAAALVLLGGAGAYFYFGEPLQRQPQPSASNDMLVWAPADSQSIMYMDVDAIRRVEDIHNEMLLAGDANQYGIRSDDISAVMAASRGGGGPFGMQFEPDIVAVKLNRPADRKAITEACSGREAAAGGKTYYRVQRGGGIHFSSDRTVVIAKSESTLIRQLQKDAGQVVISEDLKSAAKRADGMIPADGMITFANVGRAAQESDILGMLATQKMIRSSPGGANPGGRIGSATVARVTVLSVKVVGGKGTMRFETTYDSPDAARRVADDLRRTLNEYQRQPTKLESFNVSQSGPTVTLTSTGKVDKGKKFMPFGM